MLRLIPFILIALAAFFIVALRYLPWWGIVLLLLGLYLSARLAMKYLVVRLFMMPFKAKGAVLKGATTEVHSVAWEPAPAKPPRPEPAMPSTQPHAALEYDATDEPTGEHANGGDMPEPHAQVGERIEDEYQEEHDEEQYDETEDEDIGPCDHYRIDVTITPQPKAGGFQHWEPDSLVFMPYEASVPSLLGDDKDVGYPTVEVEVFQNGQFAPDEDGKYFGPLRVRLLTRVPLDAPRRLKFRYYFESFGDVTLPPSLVAST